MVEHGWIDVVVGFVRKDQIIRLGADGTTACGLEADLTGSGVIRNAPVVDRVGCVRIRDRGMAFACGDVDQSARCSGQCDGRRRFIVQVEKETGDQVVVAALAGSVEVSVIR